jgi:hypothetical protein
MTRAISNSMMIIRTRCDTIAQEGHTTTTDDGQCNSLWPCTAPAFSNDGTRGRKHSVPSTADVPCCNEGRTCQSTRGLARGCSHHAYLGRRCRHHERQELSHCRAAHCLPEAQQRQLQSQRLCVFGLLYKCTAGDEMQPSLQYIHFLI